MGTELQEKSITDLSMDDVKFELDRSKSYDQQAEDVVNAMATARAVADEKVAKDLTEHKAEELRFKSEAKSKQAEADSVKAETSKQEAERLLYEGVLTTFGITKHLPQWLMKIMVTVLSPIYVLLTLLIGVPFGLVKTIIDNADNVLCRYENVDEKVKPKLKTTFVVLISLSVLAAVLLTALKIFDKI